MPAKKGIVGGKDVRLYGRQFEFTICTEEEKGCTMIGIAYGKTRNEALKRANLFNEADNILSAARRAKNRALEVFDDYVNNRHADFKTLAGEIIGILSEATSIDA